MQLFFLMIGFVILGGLSILVTFGVLAIISTASTPVVVLVSVICTFVVTYIIASVAETKR